MHQRRGNNNQNFRTIDGGATWQSMPLIGSAKFAHSRQGFDYEPPVGPEDYPTLPSHMR